MASSEPADPSGTSSWGPSAADPGYTFMYPDGAGQPAAWWNPCATIRYAVNLGDAPEWALADAVDAVAQVSAASDLRFSFAGTTDFVPSAGGPPGQMPAGIDAVIGWVTPEQLGGPPGQAGVGGSWWEPTAGGNRIYEGYALINGDLAKTVLRPGFGAGYSEGRLLLHELGHLAGLGHTSDAQEIMYPQQSPLAPTSYGPGDIAGLQQLGARPCG